MYLDKYHAIIREREREKKEITIGSLINTMQKYRERKKNNNGECDKYHPS